MFSSQDGEGHLWMLIKAFQLIPVQQKMYRRSRTFFTCNLNRESLQNTVCFHMTFYSKRALSHVCHIATWPSLQRSIWFHQFKVWCVPYQIGSTLNWYLVSGEKTGEYTAISKGWPCKTVSPGSSCSVINKVEIQKIDWFFFYCLTSRSRIFQSYRDVERRRCICRIRKKVGGGLYCTPTDRDRSTLNV